MSVLGQILALLSAVFGVGLLRAAWAHRGGWYAVTAAGWLLLLAGAGFWHYSGLGWDKAVAFAALGPSMIAFVILVRQAEWRPRTTKARRTRQPAARALGARQAPVQDPEQVQGADPTPMRGAAFALGAKPSPSNSLARGLARFILAGPVALAAALGITMAVALPMPWADADRLVTAGLLLPLAWAACAAWATMEESLVKVAVVLGVAAVAFAGRSLL